MKHLDKGEYAYIKGFMLANIYVYKRINKPYYDDVLVRAGIKTWLEKNLIVQVKRPITLGNKGDYTGNNERLDAEFSKNPLFAKFDTIEEYMNYDRAFESDETYEAWFMKNGSSLTSVSLSE